MSLGDGSRLVALEFGASLSWPNNHHPQHGVSGWSSAGVTLRELCMMQIMDRITDKDDWDTKIFDESIASKWCQEAFSSGADVSEKMMAWVIAELKDKAKEFQRDRMLVTMEREVCMVKADNFVDPLIKDLLKTAIQPLEALKDWHPGSNETVLDLVHPSLYPLMYGRTKVLPTGSVPLKSCSTFTGQGEILPIMKIKNASDREPRPSGPSEGYGHHYSEKFQWLPSNVNLIATNGEAHAQIVSYINNLHPLKHEKLYRVLEHITDKSVALWDRMFAAIDRPRPPRIEYDGDEPFLWPQGRDRPESEKTPNETEDEAMDLDASWQEQNRTVYQPEPSEYDRYDNSPQTPNLVQVYGDKGGLQIIYKLANIHLTPDNPKYSGGSWHVEGMLNEHIVGTALYYYDCENITESNLCFRQSMAQATETLIMIPPQDEYQGVEAVYGIEQEGPAIQEYGRILTKEDRLLVFPNVLQHRVDSFELLDKTKPGHRKIVALFLVDPKLRILSTANVPPQQKEWWAPHLRSIGPFSELPQEIFDLVVDSVDEFPMSRKEAEEVRLQLMDERTNFVDIVNEEWAQQTFNFCEH